MKQSVVGIIRKNEKFLLGLREPGGDVGGCWEFPGGKCEQGETHTQALIREYEEELFVTVSVGAFLGKQEFRSGSRAFDLFAYEIFLPEGYQLQSAVHTALQWFSFEELAALNLVPSDALFIPTLKEFYRL
ncbi:MAG: (deoxy)nucleoside triphosphate pyrophosphohydrolase [Treponema sp.]